MNHTTKGSRGQIANKLDLIKSKTLLMRWGGGESARTDGGSWKKKNITKEQHRAANNNFSARIWYDFAFLFFLRFEKLPADRKESTCWMSTLTRILLFHQKVSISLHSSAFFLLVKCFSPTESLRWVLGGSHWAANKSHPRQTELLYAAAWMLFFEYHFHGRSQWSLQVCVAFLCFCFPCFTSPLSAKLSLCVVMLAHFGCRFHTVANFCGVVRGQSNEV